MGLVVSVVSIRPEGGSRLRCGDYDLDAVVVELDGGTLDFRFELGQGLGIFWALPAGEGDRLRLAHVDGAAYTVDEPTLCADPFQFDLPATTWAGELGQREQVAVARPHGRRSAAPTHTRRCQRLAPPPDIRDSPLESPAIAPFTGCGAQ